MDYLFVWEMYLLVVNELSWSSVGTFFWYIYKTTIYLMGSYYFAYNVTEKTHLFLKKRKQKKCKHPHMFPTTIDENEIEILSDAYHQQNDENEYYNDTLIQPKYISHFCPKCHLTEKRIHM